MRQKQFDDSPAGFKPIHTLVGHRQRIRWMAWSPDGTYLASCSDDRRILVWDMRTGKAREPLIGHKGHIYGLAWSPDGRRLASCSEDRSVRIWDVPGGRLLSTLLGHNGQIYSVAWSPRASLLASCGFDRTVRLWDVVSEKERFVLQGHSGPVYSVVWSPDGHTLASASSDTTIRLWDSDTSKQQRELKAHFGPVYSLAWSPDDILASGAQDRTVRLWNPRKGLSTYQFEGHSDSVTGITFSSDGRFLAAQCHDGSTFLWSRGSADPVAQLEEHLEDPIPDWLNAPMKNAAFHPSTSTIATLVSQDMVIRVWDLLVKNLSSSDRSIHNIQYTNAKVVLVGESGVGKTGLARALMEQPYAETDSTHGRFVWSFNTREREIDGKMVLCETLLWDLAGQPGYRVFHQLHMNEVAIALVVFDARKDADPFAGVAYWARALDAATQGRPLVKFLVAARTDRGGIPVSQSRIKEVMERYNFKDFIETSARNATGVKELANAIGGEIQWEDLPIVSTPELFRQMKQFLVAEKESGKILQPRARLLQRFQQQNPRLEAPPQVIDTCLAHLEAVGLLRRLSFRDLVLLQPEILDHYCAWLAQSAQNEPNGLGSLSEKEARAGKFKMDTDRLLAPDAMREMEKYIILATLQELVGRSIAWREQTSAGVMLVFPSEMRADLSEYTGSYIREVAFQFEGPVTAIYATLAVQLINSGKFTKEALYKNAAVFCDTAKQLCGIAVEYPDSNDDAVGRLTVFFEPGTPNDTKMVLLRYVNQQLERLALQESVQRERIYQCTCGYTIPSEAVTLRKQRRRRTVICPVCEETMPLDDLAEQSAQPDGRIATIEADADAEQQRQKRVLVMGEREQNLEIDVFLCHNAEDRALVNALADRLREQGILPWIDVAGRFTQSGPSGVSEQERIAMRIRTVAIVIGAHALGNPPEQDYYRTYSAMQRALLRSVPDRSRLPIIPVFLPDVPRRAEQLAPKLRNLAAIDFRQPAGLDTREVLTMLVETIVRQRS